MYKVLIIDDDPQFCQIISFELQKHQIGYEIANNKTEALKLIESRNEYDLILLDVFLPNKEDGLSILTYLSQNLDHKLNIPPIILVTSMSTKLFQEETKIDQYIKSASSFISKIEKPNAIADRILATIKQHKQDPNSPADQILA